MPIVIKELFPSDPLSEALEKINFNFDQVILSGGGPIGPLGPQGVPGIPGPQGDRGDHWQVGTTAPTADHGPNYGALKDYDFWISATGQIYYWSIGTTSWINSGKNLTGPTGSPGATGGSYEIQMYRGSTGNANTPFSIPAVTATQNYTPGLGGATTVPSGGVDFIIPANIEKNSFFLGDKSWAYSKLNNFGVYDVYASGNIQRLTPKQVIIQTKIDWTGLGGLSIGAYGATSAVGATQTNYIGVSSAVTDALNFFTAGFAYKNVGPNYAHFFKMRTGTIDLEISAGDSNFTPLSAGKTPDLILRSNRTLISDWSSARITIGATSTIFREKAAIGHSSAPTFDSSSTLDNSGIMRSRGDIYVGALNGLQNTIHIGYARTTNGSSALNFYTNGSTPTTANFTIGRVSGANGVATIDQTGTGALLLNSTVSGSYIELRANQSNGSIRFSGFNMGVTEVARIDTINSRVGIGTTTPSNKLDVVGNEIGLRAGAYGNAGSLQFINSTGSPVSSRIAFGADGTNWKLAFAKNISGTFTDLMTLESFGNLGIGTTTPGSKLDVYGSVNVYGGLTNTSTRPPISAGTLTNGEIRGYNTLGNDDGFLRLSAGAGTTYTVKSFIDLSGYSTVADMNQNIRFGTQGFERIRIDKDGNLGIGTSTPIYRVQIEGDAANSIVIRSKNTTIGTQNNIVLQRSNLAAATPNAYVLGGLSFGGYDGTNWTVGSDGGSQILSYSSGTWTSISRPSDLRFLTTPINTIASVERMKIMADGTINIGGAVGIGTGATAPNSKLDVVGSLILRDFTSATSTGPGISLLSNFATDITNTITIQNSGSGNANLNITLDGTQMISLIDSTASSYKSVNFFSNGDFQTSAGFGGQVRISGSQSNSAINSGVFQIATTGTGAIPSHEFYQNNNASTYKIRTLTTQNVGSQINVNNTISLASYTSYSIISNENSNLLYFSCSTNPSGFHNNIENTGQIIFGGNGIGNEGGAFVINNWGRTNVIGGAGVQSRYNLEVAQNAAIGYGLGQATTILDVASSADLRYHATTGNSWIAVPALTAKLAVNGGVLCGWIVTTSDKRLKKDIISLDSTLEKLKKINPVSYTWKENEIPHAGFIAQEIEKIIPEVIRITPSDEFEDGRYSIHYESLIAYSIKGIQEQQEIIESQEEKILSLEEKIARIEKLLNI